MLINLVYVVTAITDGGWPHMSLISHVGARRCAALLALGGTEAHTSSQGTSDNNQIIHTHRGA